MALPQIAKIAVSIIYGVLYIIGFASWTFDTIYYKENWVCMKCRKSEEPSINQQFLFFSVWSFWLSMAVFFTWSCSRQKTTLRAIAQRIIQVALPLACTVMICYICYVLSYSRDDFLNFEECYTLKVGRARMSKDITDNMFIVNFYLVCSVLADIVAHYLSAPLLLLLVLSGELEFDSSLPYSTIFATILGATICLADIFGSRIYCGNLWFNIPMTVLANLSFDMFFVLRHRRSKSKEAMDKPTMPIHIFADDNTETMETYSYEDDIEAYEDDIEAALPDKVDHDIERTT